MNQDTKIRILAIESSSRQAAAAVFECTKPLSAKPSNFLASLFSFEDSPAGFSQPAKSACKSNSFQRLDVIPANGAKPNNSTDPIATSSTLVPAIQDALNDARLKSSEIDLVVVSLGPGSFTGLRIGVVAAKAFAFSTGCSVVGIDVMRAIAIQALVWARVNQLDPPDASVAVAVNAGRGQIFAATYSVNNGQLQTRSAGSIQEPQQWLSQLKPESLISGNGIALLNSSILADFRYVLPPENVRVPQIETIAKLGLAKFAMEGGEDFWKLQPIYSRPSAAEEVQRARESDDVDSETQR